MDTTIAMYCMQIPGKTEGTAFAACLLNETSRGSHARIQDKNIFQTALLVSLILRAGQKRGVFSNYKSSSCFKWAGVKKSTLLCIGDLTVLDQGEQQLHSSSSGFWSRKKRQHRPVVAWYFDLNSCPLISDTLECLEHLITNILFPS